MISDLLIAAIEMHQALLGRTPRLVAADAAFYSAKNEAAEHLHALTQSYTASQRIALDHADVAKEGFGD